MGFHSWHKHDRQQTAKNYPSSKIERKTRKEGEREREEKIQKKRKKKKKENPKREIGCLEELASQLRTPKEKQKTIGVEREREREKEFFTNLIISMSQCCCCCWCRYDCHGCDGVSMDSSIVVVVAGDG